MASRDVGAGMGVWGVVTGPGGRREVVAALKHRIGREDRELYDLIDRAGLTSAA